MAKTRALTRMLVRLDIESWRRCPFNWSHFFYPEHSVNHSNSLLIQSVFQQLVFQSVPVIAVTFGVRVVDDGPEPLASSCEEHICSLWPWLWESLLAARWLLVHDKESLLNYEYVTECTVHIAKTAPASNYVNLPRCCQQRRTECTHLCCYLIACIPNHTCRNIHRVFSLNYSSACLLKTVGNHSFGFFWVDSAESH